MALSEPALNKLSKGDIINLALDYQSEFNSTLVGIRNEISDLKKRLWETWRWSFGS